MIEIKRRWDTRAQWMNTPGLVARVVPNVAHWFPVYTKAEADSLGMTYTYWKHAEKDMEWILTDDEYVMQALYVRYYARSGRTMNKMVQGSACPKRFVTSRMTMMFEEQHNIRRYSGIPSTYDINVLLRKKRTQAAILAYCNMILAGSMDLKTVYNALVDKGNKPGSNRKAEKIWKYILKTQEGKAAVDAEMQRILAGKGITREWVLDVQLDALNIARDKKDPLTMVKIAESIVKLSGLDKPKQEDDFFGALNESSTNNHLLEAGFTEIREISDANDLLCEEPRGSQGPDETPSGQDEEETELHLTEGFGEEHPDSGGLPIVSPVC